MLLSRLAIFPAWMVPPATLAFEAVPPDIGGGALFIKTIMGLGIVIGSILVLAWLLKRLRVSQALRSQDIKILSSMAMGTREKIVLVEVENKKILLGFAPGNISSLHVFTDRDGDGTRQRFAGDSGSAAGHPVSDIPPTTEQWNFARYLQSLINNGSRT